MDPVSALGAAAAALALVERAIKTGRDIKKIYDSVDGIRDKEKALLEQSDTLSIIVKDLRNASTDARKGLVDSRMREISSKCVLLSLAIQKVIDKCRHKDMSVLSTAISAAQLWLHKSDIDNLQKELERHQSALTSLATTQILFVLLQTHS